MWSSKNFLIIIILSVKIYEICSKNEIDGRFSCDFFSDPKKNYSLWTPKDQERKDLYCPESIRLSLRDKRIFCSCCSIPRWKYEQIRIGNLQLEYLNRRGKSFLLDSENQAVLHRIQKENGFLSALPINYCQFTTIVEIFLKGNLIEDLPPLTCLSELDTIDLSYNQLRFISNTSISGLKKLRRIDFSYNLITEIEPFTFNNIDHVIMMVDFSFNKLRTLDITNMVALKGFCFASYQGNGIKTFSNKSKYKVLKNQTFGDGGYVNLAFNKIQRLPDPAEFGMSFSDYGKLAFYKYLFDVRNNEIVCDCGLETFLRYALHVKDHWSIAGESLGLFCYYPSNMQEDLPLNDLLTPLYLDRLICNGTMPMPKGCNTYFQPSQNRIVINCTSADISTVPSINMTEFLQSIPYEETKTQFVNASVHAIFRNNSIKELTNTSYMTKAYVIDVSSNNINKLRVNALLSLPRYVDMDIGYNPELRYLPRHLQRMESERIHMKGIRLSCTCEDEMYKWLPEWLPRNVSFSPHCYTGNEEMYAKNVSADILGCTTGIKDFVLNAVIPLLLASTLITTLFLVSYVYRYDIYVLYRQYRHKYYSGDEMYLYDIYISMDESHPTLMRWLVSKFLPFLQYKGYKTYVPTRDLTPGEVKEEGIVEAINYSRCTIVFLTSGFCEEDNIWMEVEWRNAWKHYKSDLCSKLIVVNFDLVRFQMIPYRPMKAILRFQNDTLFSSTKFIKDITKKIGSPIGKKRIHNANRKPTFDISQLEPKLFSPSTRWQTGFTSK
ncbi:hypothetical protein FSP39_022833 [Pinctada imbricata]|uniref:TIR domain-containing protein n=1 Tax=Pinctada imbricata TaxID=66713 RepID=A0AA88Y0D5_PINIB|nr:hypothetical protein FSP39_022833 [Pinctada imbricata]